MSSRNVYSYLAFPFALLACIAPVHAKNRISGRIDSARKVTLTASRRPVQADTESDRGRVDPSMVISYARLVFQPTAEQTDALEQLLEEQRDPSSPNYQRWLTPEEFADQFSVSENDANQITSWLQAEGFTVERMARARNWIAISGTASQFENTFQTEIHQFQGSGEGHFANATALKIPVALAGVVSEVRGLHNYLWSAPRLKNFGAVAPNYTSTSGAHYMAPDDFATIYNVVPLYSAGFTGAGQKIAVVGQSGVTLSDITAFRTRFNLPANPPQMVLYGSNPGILSGDSLESTLDLEWAGAVARDATLLFVYSTNVILSAEYVVDQNLAQVISISYGGCEASNSSSLRSVAQQANAEGITWLASSGDSGAAACDASSAMAATHGLSVNMPASIPEVTAVGGTTFNEGPGTYWSSTTNASGGSVLSYIPETAWNDAVLEGSLAATGGGVSVLFAKPSWQSGTGVPADGVRDVPDISGTAAAAHDAYLIVTNGSLSAVGGTSAPTPAYAGVLGLLNQYLVSKGTLTKAGLGNINPTLYHLAQTTPSIFHDVTSGSNIVPCTVGTKNCTSGTLGYSAGIGYDLVTGLGTLDVNALATGWSGGSVTSSTGTTTTVSASPTTLAQNASTVLTATVKPASGTTAPTGTVVFKSGSTTLGSASLTTSGMTGVASLTVAGAALAVGTDTITATYSGSTTFMGSTGSTTASVTAVASTATTTTVSSNPAGFAQNATTVLTATVRPASGTTAPTGTMVFTSGSTRLGSAPLTASGTSGVATLAVSGASLAVGTDTITATYSGSTAFGGSNATTTVSVTAVGGTASNVTATATPNPVTAVRGAWTFNVKLSDGGGATKLTGMSINGTNYTSSITSWFGTTQLAAGGSVSVNLVARGVSPGTKEVFVFSGADPSGRTWSTTLTVTLN